MLGSLSIVVAHHVCDASLSIYSNRLCDTTFIIHTPYGLVDSVVGGAAHAAIFMVRDYTRLTITIIY
jgi:hypothetical protein